MSFRLTSLLWACAVLAVALATFGPLGIPLGIIVLAFWARVFSNAPMKVTELCIILGILGVLAALLIPAVDGARESARRSVCVGYLSQLRVALENYAAQHGTLPPASAPTVNGGPAQSWRVRILPHMEEQSLYNAYQPHERWNGPTNAALARTPLPWYQCPSDPPAASSDTPTNYFVVVGSNTAFLPDRGRRWDEFTDDRSQTILLMEAAGRNTPWLKPDDLSFDDAVDLLSNPPPEATRHWSQVTPTLPSFFYKRELHSVLNVLFADGSYASLKLPLSRELATALLTIDGGEAIDEKEFRRSTRPHLDYAKIYAFAAFVLLAVLPAYRLVRRKPSLPRPAAT